MVQTCACLLNTTIFLAGWTLETHCKWKSEEQIQKSPLLYLVTTLTGAVATGQHRVLDLAWSKNAVHCGKHETLPVVFAALTLCSSPSRFLSSPPRPASQLHVPYCFLPNLHLHSLPLSSSPCKSQFRNCFLEELSQLSLLKLKTLAQQCLSTLYLW